MLNPKTLLSLTLLLSLFCSHADACLTFCLQHENHIVYGRNFDWPVDVGAVIVNQRHVRKRAFVVPPEEAMSWRSKYGSVTFNQFSKEVPVGGMNERGLVIESLVSEAIHPRRDDRKAINELQWIQYHLDTCRSVAEVLESAGRVRISPYAVRLHYFVSDRTGKSAVIEFLRGKMVTRSGKDLPATVLANTSYDRAVQDVPSRDSRFGRAARLLKKYDGTTSPVKHAYEVLDAVAQGDFTKWQIAYDISSQKIYFRTLRSHKLKTIALADVDFQNTTEAMMVDINTDEGGTVQKRFRTYTEGRNDELLNACMKSFKQEGMMRHITPLHVAHIRNVVAGCKYEQPQQPKKR